jgi:hypothetical protein
MIIVAAAQHQPSAMIPFWRDRTRDFFRFRHVTDEKISALCRLPLPGSAAKRLRKSFSKHSVARCE